MRKLAAMAFVGIGISFLACFEARADIQYIFHGTCTDITYYDRGHAMQVTVPCSSLISPIALAFLSMTDSYVPGTFFSQDRFTPIDQTFIASDPIYLDFGPHIDGSPSPPPFTFVWSSPVAPPAFIPILAVGLLPESSGAATVGWVDPLEGDARFQSGAGGTWSLVCCGPMAFHFVNGVDGIWTRVVPEPNTIALIGIALAGFGLSRRRYLTGHEP